MRKTFEKIMYNFNKEFNERVLSRLPAKESKIDQFVREYK